MSLGSRLQTLEELELQPIPKASLHNIPITADSNILGRDVVPTRSPGMFRIYACFDTAGALKIRRTKDGITHSENLNGGSTLSAQASYLFDILVEHNEEINLWYSVAATAKIILMVEIGGIA